MQLLLVLLSFVHCNPFIVRMCFLSESGCKGRHFFDTNKIFHHFFCELLQKYCKTRKQGGKTGREKGKTGAKMRLKTNKSIRRETKGYAGKNRKNAEIGLGCLKKTQSKGTKKQRGKAKTHQHIPIYDRYEVFPKAIPSPIPEECEKKCRAPRQQPQTSTLSTHCDA